MALYAQHCILAPHPSRPLGALPTHHPLLCSEKGKKLVELDVALAMWDLLLPPSRWQHIEAWKEFMRTHHKRPVSRDTWNQLLEFVLVRRRGWGCCKAYCCCLARSIPHSTMVPLPAAGLNWPLAFHQRIRTGGSPTIQALPFFPWSRPRHPTSPTTTTAGPGPT